MNKIAQPKTSVLFEYPLQENIRSFLRLEYLFQQFQRNLVASSNDNHLHALKILFEILEILQRGDTRSELIKELSRLLDYFSTLESNPEVDSSKLVNFLAQIKQLNQWVHGYQGKFGESIRKDPFIQTVKHRSVIPGGSCQFDCPDLFLFMNKNCKTRQNQLNQWLDEIKGIQTSIEVILRLIRENGNWKIQHAPLGSFMIETSGQTFKLLRIKFADPHNQFPEISSGKHRTSIHFMTFNSRHKKVPLNALVEFELACCS